MHFNIQAIGHLIVLQIKKIIIAISRQHRDTTHFYLPLLQALAKPFIGSTEAEVHPQRQPKEV